MIDRKHKLSVTRQAELLGISRGAVYYLPRATGAADLALMHRIDHCFHLGWMGHASGIANRQPAHT